MKTRDINRVFGLDVFRATAIIIVLLGHGKSMLNGTLFSGFPYIELIDGVDLFFVLSGFLIGRILLKQINGLGRLSFSGLVYFWKRRWFRTLPNYYLILLLNLVLVKYDYTSGDIGQASIEFLFFLQNFATPFYGFFWESWSLAVEEWFYIVTPILLFFSTKLMSAKRAFLLSILIMIVSPIIYRALSFDLSLDYFWWDVTFRKVVLYRIDSIGYGLLAAWVSFYYCKLWTKIKIPAFLVSTILIVFIVSFKQDPNTIYKQVIYFSLLPFSLMFLLPIADGYKQAKGRSALAIQHISKISYSMYLIHLGLVAQVIGHNFSPQGGIDGVLKYILYWVIVILSSSLLYKYFEKPIMDLREKNISSEIKTKKRG